MTGYIIRLNGVEHDGYRNGRPFRLVDAWRETDGLNGCDILAPNGRVVLANAGARSTRYGVSETVRQMRYSRNAKRHAVEIHACPNCGHECYRGTYGGGWTHGYRRGESCTVEYFSPDSITRPTPPRHAFEVVADFEITV